MEDAAYVIGKTKKTMYNHKDRNKFSYEQDNEGKIVIDVSELLRVYGSSPDITQRLEELQNGTSENESEITPSYTDTKKMKKAEETTEYRIKIAQLEAELEKEKALKHKAEDEIDYFKTALDKAQETAKQVTLLLEDKSEESRGADKWENTFKALESRISNQEKAAKDREEREQKLLDENRRIKQAYSKQRKALEEEKNKPFWKKLFG